MHTNMQVNISTMLMLVGDVGQLNFVMSKVS